MLSSNLSNSILKNLNESSRNNSLYYCKLTHTRFGKKSIYYIAYEDGKYTWSPNLRDAIALTKSDWDDVLADFNDIDNLKVSFIKATNEELIVLYYIFHSDWQGSWGPSQFKTELKNSGINVVAVEKETQYHRYGSPEKYYKFYIPKSQEDIAKRFVDNAKNMADVSFDAPSY